MHLRTTLLSLALVPLVACGALYPSGSSGGTDFQMVGMGDGADNDGDGYGERIDCDDANADVNPGEEELCADGVDNDCDGEIDGEDDNANRAPHCFDGDGDGFCDDYNDNGVLDAGDTVQMCESSDADIIAEQTDGDVSKTASYIEVVDSGPPLYEYPAADCDDADANTFPGAPETCDGLDNDCDASTPIDESMLMGTFYADADGDMYGDAAVTQEACDASDGWVADDTDCDDADPMVNPGATEVCDDVDNDCDAATAEPTSWFYQDMDGDMYGDAGVSAEACEPSEGWVADDSDCDDTDPMVNPGAMEVCDGIDNDCDVLTLDPTTTFYQDMDGDMYGDAGMSAEACDAPVGYVADDRDCDDADASAYPGAAETCANDGTDNDCDGSATDTPVDESVWYADVDDDGFGDETDPGFSSCDMPVAPFPYGNQAGDCNDANSAVNPDATEILNGIDDNCDDVIDDVTSCTTDVYVLSGSGQATSVTGVVSDDATLSGDWMSSVSGVSVTPYSLGGDAWEYRFTMGLCISASGSIILDGDFTDGTSLADDASANVTAYLDGTSLRRNLYDNGDGTNSYEIVR